MIIKISINDFDTVEDLMAVGAEDFASILKSKMKMKIDKVVINHITKENLEKRDEGKDYQYYSSSSKGANKKCLN